MLHDSVCNAFVFVIKKKRCKELHKDVIRKNCRSYRLIIVKICSLFRETNRKRLNNRKKIEIKFEEAIEFPIGGKEKRFEIQWMNKRAGESKSASK